MSDDVSVLAAADTAAGSLLPFPAAVTALCDAASLLPVETVLLADAHGRVLADAVRIDQPVPPAATAACDGFAARARDLLPGGNDGAVLLPVAGVTHPGDAPLCGLPHTVREVFTGTLLPEPFDCVLPLQQTPVASRDEDGTPRWVRVAQPLAAGSNVRSAGEDFPAGSVVAEAGTALRAAHLMALAMAGIDRVRVRVRPRVAVVSTGRELVDDARDALGPGQVRNANAPWLVAMLRRHGALPRYLRTIADSSTDLCRSLAWAAQQRCPLVLSSGATANSRADFVGAVLEQAGAVIVFRGVAMRPGWPVLAAVLPYGGLFVGLPGNPASCVTCFRALVVPLLRAMQGLPPEQANEAFLLHDVRRDPERTLLLKARSEIRQGRLVAAALGGQEPHRVAPLLAADSLLVIPAGNGCLAAGSRATVLPMNDDGCTA
jgi:molybdopterin molybdotransferase